MHAARRTNRGAMLATLLIAPFMAQADATIANVATPSIRAHLHASGSELELVIGGYMIAFAVLLITGARLGQTHGYRRAFIAGVAVFMLASLACALAPTPLVLIAARVLQGTGAALMFPQVLTGIQLHFDAHERARAIGLYALALSIGAVCGQLLGGALVSANVAGLHWRAIFLVNVPVGLAVIASAARSLPRDQARTGRSVDLAGVATLSIAVLLIAVPLALGRSLGWPLWTWVCLTLSVPAAALFVAVERSVASRGGAPLVNLEALSGHRVRWGLCGVAAATGTYYGLLFTLALYLQQGLGRTPAVSGLTLVPWVAAFGIAGQVVRRLPDDRRALAAPVGCAVLAAAYLAIAASLYAGQRGEALLVPLLAIGGLGLGLQFSAIISHLTGSVDPRYAPDISGVATTVMQIAGALGVAAFGTLYIGQAGHGGTGTAGQSFATTALGFAAVAAVAAGAALRSTWTADGPLAQRFLSARRSAL